jgi:spermidine synthase
LQPGLSETINNFGKCPKRPAVFDLATACCSSLFFLSGFAALGYEILWTRLLSLILGAESLGVLGVLAGFFAGIVIGAVVFDRKLARVRHPVRVFAAFEVFIAVFAILSPHLLYGLARAVPAVLGPIAGDNDTLVALALSVTVAGGVLLPATLFMGGTLVALVNARLRAMPADPQGRGLGRLYAANTIGAAAGTMASVYLVLPALGLASGSVALASLSLVSAVSALLWERRHRDWSGEITRPEPIPTPAPFGRALYLLAFGTGLAGIGLEIAAIQLVSQVLENTVYTFANLLAVYLVGTALGASLFQRAPVDGQRRGLLAELLLGLTLSVALLAVLLGQAPAVLRTIAPPGSSYAWHLLSELALSFIVFLAPTIAMGATFSLIVGTFESSGVGTAYGVNTLGAALAPFVFGLMAIETIGFLPTLYLVMGTYFLLCCLGARIAALPWRWILTASAVSFAAWLLAPRALDLIDIPRGWTVLARQEGQMGAVIVTEQESEGDPWALPPRRLQVNKHFRMGGGASFGEKRMGHLPLLLAPGAREALFLGVGTGTTLGAVRQYPLETVEGVEIVPQILKQMHWFDALNEGIRSDRRVRLHAADARRYVAASRERFDVIVADLFHPGRDGAGSLYSREHYRALREHLREGGLTAQWVPLYQFDEYNLKVLVRTFLEVFPEVHSFLGLYSGSTPLLLLVGRAPPSGDDGLVLDADFLAANLGPERPAGKVVANESDLLAAYLTDREGLAAAPR